MHAGLECIACYLPTCPLSTTCMDALTARQVWMAIDRPTAYAPGHDASLSRPATPMATAAAVRPLIPLHPIGGPRVAAGDVSG